MVHTLELLIHTNNSGFDPRVAHAGIMVNRVALGRVFLQVDGHYLSNVIPPMPCVHILLIHTACAT